MLIVSRPFVMLAVGGATTFDTGRGPNLTNAETGEQVVIPSTLTQLETYVSNGTVSANALYIILTGGNDFLGGYNVSGEMSAMAVQGGVDRLIGGGEHLPSPVFTSKPYSDPLYVLIVLPGAEHILLINLFDIAIPATQAAADNSTSEESPLGSVATQFTTELSVAYNQIFSAANYTNVVAISDLFTASKVIAVSADQFGFDPERLTEPCLQSTVDESTGVTNYTICDNPNGAFFWDEGMPLHLSPCPLPASSSLVPSDS
jgi:phospholipase/lecithinase/hemolysin